MLVNTWMNGWVVDEWSLYLCKAVLCSLSGLVVSGKDLAISHLLIKLPMASYTLSSLARRAKTPTSEVWGEGLMKVLYTMQAKYIKVILRLIITVNYFLSSTFESFIHSFTIEHLICTRYWRHKKSFCPQGAHILMGRQGRQQATTI